MLCLEERVYFHPALLVYSILHILFPILLLDKRGESLLVEDLSSSLILDEKHSGAEHTEKSKAHCPTDRQLFWFL